MSYLIGAPSSKTRCPSSGAHARLALAGLAALLCAWEGPAAASDTCEIIGVAVAGRHGLALTSGGDVLVWGSNLLGEFGNGDTGETTVVPVPSTSMRDSDAVRVVATKAGSTSVALLADGTVWTWGWGHAGQLGHGAVVPMATRPVQVIGLDSVTELAAGLLHMLAVRGDRTLWSWGGNGLGQLGIGTVSPREPTPAQVTALSDVVAVGAGPYHSLAVLGDGSVWAWGDNEWDQLGIGARPLEWESTPQEVTALAGVTIVSVVGGESHSLALDSNGDMWAWGLNRSGQLGDGTFIDRPLPVRVTGPGTFVQIAAGAGHSLAQDSSGNVWSWGDGSSGALGTGETGQVNVPTQITSISNVVGIDAARTSSFAWLAEFTAYGWGAGALGTGYTVWPTDSHFPRPVLVDTRPLDQGNVLRVARDGMDDVRLEFSDGLSLWWRLYADADKRSLGTTRLTPVSDVDVPSVIDRGAVSRPGDIYYSFSGLSSCSQTEGPVSCLQTGTFCSEQWQCCEGLACHPVRWRCE